MRSAWFGCLVAAGMLLTACGGGSGYEYHGPRLPHTQPAAASIPPPPGRGEAPPIETAPQADQAAPAAEGQDAPRVLAPVPRTRAEGVSGPVTVLAPDRPEEVNVPEDPRSPSEVSRDKAAWDRCVLNATVRRSEDVSSRPPTGPTPEEQCAQSLGMANRNAIPKSVRR